jgi:hypothetical protein
MDGESANTDRLSRFRQTSHLSFPVRANRALKGAFEWLNRRHA